MGAPRVPAHRDPTEERNVGVRLEPPALTWIVLVVTGGPLRPAEGWRTSRSPASTGGRLANSPPAPNEPRRRLDEEHPPRLPAPGEPRDG